MTFAQELRRLREKAGLSQQKLADLAGVKQSYVGNLETGRNKSAAPDVVAKLAKALGVAADHFTPYLPASSAAAHSLAQRMTVPLVGVVGAGPPRDDAYPDGEVLHVHELFPGNVAAFRVSGDSMLADQIADGDYVVVRLTPEAAAGERVVAWLASEHGTVLKRLKGRAAKRWLESDGWRHDLADGDRVFGAYVGVIRRSKP